MPSRRHHTSSSAAGSSKRRHSGDDNGSNKAPKRGGELTEDSVPNTIHGVQISVGPPASIDTGKRFPWAIVATIQHNQDTTVWYTGELVVKNVSSGQKVQLGEATARGDSENYYDLQNRRNDLGYLIFNPAAIPDYMVGQCELIVKVYRVNMTGKRRHQDVVSSQFAVTTAGVSAQPAILVDQRDILDHLISRGYLSRWT